MFLLQVLVLLPVRHASSRAITTPPGFSANTRPAAVEIKSSPHLLRRAPPIVKATSSPNARSRASFPPRDPPQALLNPMTRGTGAIVPLKTREKTGAPNSRTPQPPQQRRRAGLYFPPATQTSRVGLVIRDLPGISAFPGSRRPTAAISQYPHRRVAELRRGGLNHPTQLQHPSQLLRPAQPFSIASTSRQYPQRPYQQPAQQLAEPAKSPFTRYEALQSRKLRARPGSPFYIPSGLGRSPLKLPAVVRGEHLGEPQRSAPPKTRPEGPQNNPWERPKPGIVRRSLSARRISNSNRTPRLHAYSSVPLPPPAHSVGLPQSLELRHLISRHSNLPFCNVALNRVRRNTTPWNEVLELVEIVAAQEFRKICGARGMEVSPTGSSSSCGGSGRASFRSGVVKLSGGIRTNTPGQPDGILQGLKRTLTQSESPSNTKAKSTVLLNMPPVSRMSIEFQRIFNSRLYYHHRVYARYGLPAYGDPGVPVRPV